MTDGTPTVDIPEQESEPAGGQLWVRWVAANAVGEVLGLGLLGIVVGLLASQPSVHIPGWVRLPGVLLLGTLEGVLVGTAQWLAMRRALPRLRAREWIQATAAGALLAWVLGMLPSTIMDLVGASSASQTPPPEISDAVRMLLAVGLGVVAGPILAGVQWRVLRRHVPRAGWWIPANSLAWSLGMPLVFVAVGAVASQGHLTPWGMAFGLVMIAGAGTVVGMVHGLVLVQLLRRVLPRRIVLTGGARSQWLSAEFTALGILELLIGLSAIVSGVMFTVRPNGALVRMPLESLQDTPFRSFLVPGLILAAIVGGWLLFGGVLALRRHALGAIASLGAGILLMGWISVQVALIGYVDLLQPICFSLGLVIVAIGLAVMAQCGELRRR